MTHQIKPINGHPLAEMRRGEQTIYQFFIRGGASIRDKPLDELRRWWQTGQITREPPNERYAVGLPRRLQALILHCRQSESVDFIANKRVRLNRRRRRVLHWEVIAPLPLSRRSLFDPPLAQLNLLPRHRLAG